MLVLSILIMLALAVAVASFFIAGAQWLLFVSAALVILAFYLSRRAAHSVPEPDFGLGSDRLRPVREHLKVTVDQQIIESGRHREPPEGGSPADEPEPQPETGRAIAS